MSVWKKRAEGAEKALSNKEREILDAKEVVSVFSLPLLRLQLYHGACVTVSLYSQCRQSTWKRK